MDSTAITPDDHAALDKATALSLAQALVEGSKTTVLALWRGYCQAYDTLWAADTSLGVEVELQSLMAGTPTTYLNLITGQSTPTNNWAALFMEAADVKHVVQAKQPELLANLPQFTDGTTRYIDPGWTLDANGVPLAPKILAPLVGP